MSSYHATAIVIGTQSILICGESGSGKTSLAHLLMDMSSQYGFAHSALISDDRTNISAIQNCAIASCPPNLEGLTERYGVGVMSTSFVKSAKIALIVEITTQQSYARMPEPHEAYTCICGINIPIVRIHTVNLRSVSLIFSKYASILTST